MKTITEIYYKMKPFTGNSSQLVLILKTQDHIFCGERWSTKIVFEHWFTYTTPLTRFKGIIKAFSGMCVLTSITSSVLIWSSVHVDFSDVSGATVGWFISLFE